MNFKSWLNLQEIGFPATPDDYNPQPTLKPWQSDRKQRMFGNQPQPEGIGEMGVEAVVNGIIKRAEQLCYERKTGRYTIPKTPLFLVNSLIMRFVADPNYKRQMVQFYVPDKTVTPEDCDEVINSLRAYLDEIEEKYANFPRVMNMKNDIKNPEWIESQYDEDYLEFLKSNGFPPPPPKSFWSFKQ